jgi:hypothetical protein
MKARITYGIGLYLLLIGTAAASADNSLSPKRCVGDSNCPRTFVDDAPPTGDKHAKPLAIDPDKVYQIAREKILHRPHDMSDDLFLLDLKSHLQQAFSCIDLKAKVSKNIYHGVTGKIEVLYATLWEYLIIYQFEEAVGQEGKGFWSQLSPQSQNNIVQHGMGFSGLYPSTEFRTIPLIGEQITITGDGSTHIHHPGDRAYLAPGTSKFYRSGWILEHARGKLWQAFPQFLRENSWESICLQMGSVVRGCRLRWFGR